MILENGLEECTCPRKQCERHGKCAECIEHHSHKKHPCYCIRKRIKEQSQEKKVGRKRTPKAE